MSIAAFATALALTMLPALAQGAFWATAVRAA